MSTSMHQSGGRSGPVRPVGEEITRGLADWAIRKRAVSWIVCEILTDHLGAAECVWRGRYSPTEETIGAGFVRWKRKKK